jgi:hypothetical protein
MFVYYNKLYHNRVRMTACFCLTLIHLIVARWFNYLFTIFYYLLGYLYYVVSI